MPDRPDWSKLSGTISSHAFDTLNEVKQLKDSISQQGVELPDIKWSKLSDAIVSRASDALNEVKQLKDSVSQQDHIDLPHVDWSKLSDGILSRASDAMSEVKQLLLNKDLNVSWTELSAVLSRAFRAFRAPKLWNYVSISLSKLWGAIVWGTSNLRGSILFFVSAVLTEVNRWSIGHPYSAAGVLLCISGSANPALFLNLFFLPVRLSIWLRGFRSRGIERGSFASQYQSHHYGGYVPRDSPFAGLQSYEATTSSATLVSLLAYTGAVFVLGRHGVSRIDTMAGNISRMLDAGY
ncbi:hypothetical protein K503DRAFT_854243 [Rhizopogon vinicolor AM-OR11-026]|uniref:Uncharacterized protein n=1 Tax=Rhizopogon vinicolor AM-OR11-026 TaxID=1314800 RepID=A0A1B7NB48_9AGAM|nr:hypothetical protein K503DRAFT_854243 [Rhizopogon vinicolor AM-OR11-026]